MIQKFITCLLIILPKVSLILTMGTTLFHNHKDRAYHIPGNVRETGNSKMNEFFSLQKILRVNSELTHKLINIKYIVYADSGKHRVLLKACKSRK